MFLFIKLALLVTLSSTVIGWLCLRYNKTYKFISLVLGSLAFILITVALLKRGEVRGACPLIDVGEKFLFVSWSLGLFYLITGGTYRNSLIGLFTAPALSLLLGLTLLPKMFVENPEKLEVLDSWKETHAATSVLSYGALGLAALAAVMFLILDKFLKAQKSGNLSMRMPPVNSLLSAVYRLLVIGVVILTIGIVAGFISSRDSGLTHLFIAGGVWLAYIVLLTWYSWKGIPPRIFAMSASLLFLCSCGIFFII